MDTFVRMQAFVKVVDTGGFSAAARALGRSKALVSKYVRDLEDELGVRLINRTTRTLATTEAGALYYREASGILQRVEELQSEVGAAHGAITGRLKIAMPRGFGDKDITPALMEFARLHPAIAIDLSLEDRFVDLVEEGVDLAIRITEPTDSSLIARRLGPLPFVLCASPDCIARHGTPAAPEELSDRPCIIDSNYRHRTNWEFHVGEGRETVRVSGRIEVNSLHAVRTAALAGLGFARIPLSFVDEDIAAGRLVRVLAGTESSDRGVYALYPHRRHMPAKVRALLDFLVERFKKSA